MKSESKDSNKIDYKNGRVIIFSGAGISAESGLSTFRDSGGLWESYDPQLVCNYQNWNENYELVHKFYNLRRKELGKVKPNIAHEFVAKMCDEFDAINITQNVDDLFERAGCECLHLHGFLPELRCENCDKIEVLGYKEYNFHACKNCGFKRLKPNIVFFYEPAPLYTLLYGIFSSIQENDIIIVIGTSGNVININSLLGKGYKILNNLDSEITINECLFDSLYLESSSKALPKIYNEVKKLRS